MQSHITAIQYMGMLMRGESLNIAYVLSLVQIINNSYLSAKDVITILEQIFRNEKSIKIVLATQILEYLIKNSNRNFHQAANKESFQKSVLGLLKRQRGKSNIIKDLRSNSENWTRIQSKIIYLVQLWYDAFILEESKYPNIINTYKILRKQNIVFPPRNVNERSLLAVQTQSPIFDNIESIAESDKEKFKKRLKAMGLTHLSQKFEQKQKFNEIAQLKKEPRKQASIDDISEKIAIIQSQDYDPRKVMRIVEEVKSEIENAKIKPHEQKYWKEIKEAAEIMIAEWEEKNSQLIHNEEQRYLEMKISGQIQAKGKPEQQQKQQAKHEEKKTNQIWDLLGDAPQEKVTDKKDENDEWGDFVGNNTQQSQPLPPQNQNPQEMNLLDL